VSANNDFLDLLLNTVREQTEDLHTVLIGKIITINNAKRTCSLTFLNKVTKTQRGQTIQTIPSDIQEVPIPPIFASGTWEIWAKYEVGDKVLVQVLERPYQEPFVGDVVSEQQMNSRMQLGFAIIGKPIPRRQLEEVQDKANSFVIKNKKNGDFFEFTENNVVNIKTTTVNIDAADVFMTGNLHVDGDTTIGGNTTVGGNTTIGGSTTIGGNATIGGTSKAADHMSGNTSGKNHKHSGVTPGTGVTGGPV